MKVWEVVEKTRKTAKIDVRPSGKSIEKTVRN
jgi:hypothetical protein